MCSASSLTTGSARFEEARGGIAAYDAVSGAAVEIALTGVFELPKASGQLAEGTLASWDNSAHNVVAPGSGKFPIGTVVKAAGSSDPTCRVRLSGIPVVAAGA